jgi:hypothetical protein
MAVTAHQLGRAGQRNDLGEIVREQLEIIDDRLRRADRVWGRNQVLCDLPTVFDAPGLDRQTAQRIVYSSILQSLERRGFAAHIVLDPDQTTVVIVWTTALDPKEVAAMDAVIGRARIDRRDVARVAGRSTRPPPPRPARVSREPRESREPPPKLPGPGPTAAEEAILSGGRR